MIGPKVGYLLFAGLGYNKRSLRLWHGLAFRGYFVKMGTRRSVTLALLLTLAFCGQALGLRKSTGKHSHHTGKLHFRHLRWNPMFRPSHDSLLRQNEEIDRLELPRIYDDDELEQLKLSEALVPINQSQYLRFDPRLDPSRRYCRPWTRDFRRGPEPGLLPPLPRSDSGQLGRPNRLNAAQASPPQSQRRAGIVARPPLRISLASLSIFSAGA